MSQQPINLTRRGRIVRDALMVLVAVAGVWAFLFAASIAGPL